MSSIADEQHRLPRSGVDPHGMWSEEMLRSIAETTEARDIAALWVEVVNEARAVPIADEEIAVRKCGRIRRMVLREVGVLGPEGLRTHVEKLCAVGSAHRDHLPGMVRDPVPVLALVVDDVETVGSRKPMLPRSGEASRSVVGNEVVVGIVCQQHDAAFPILADAVTIPDRILVRVQSTPHPSCAVAEPALPQDLAALIVAIGRFRDVSRAPRY